MQIKDITETAIYKAVPLRNNVYDMDSICALICHLLVTGRECTDSPRLQEYLRDAFPPLLVWRVRR